MSIVFVCFAYWPDLWLKKVFLTHPVCYKEKEKRKEITNRDASHHSNYATETLWYNAVLKCTSFTVNATDRYSILISNIYYQD